MKRRLLQIIVLLVLGAIVNVAVAWGCAAVRSTKFVSVDHVNYHFDQSSLQWYMLRLECRSNDRLVWSVSPSDLESYGRHIHLPSRDQSDFAPAWSATRWYEAPTETDDGWVQIEMLVGWPSRSLYSWTLYSTPWESTGIIVDANDQNTSLLRVIPLTPRWPGFAINTIFYAAMLWVVFFVSGMVKRRVRRRRGLCPACAYPIGTSAVCTECGAAVPAAPSSRWAQ